MKKIAIAFTALLAVSQLNAGAITQVIENPILATSNNNVVKSGTVIQVTETGGSLMESGTGIIRDFYHSGAQIQFKVGDNVIFMFIDLPNGKEIITEGKKGLNAVNVKLA